VQSDESKGRVDELGVLAEGVCCWDVGCFTANNSSVVYFESECFWGVASFSAQASTPLGSGSVQNVRSFIRSFVRCSSPLSCQTMLHRLWPILMSDGFEGCSVGRIVSASCSWF
jgi:hypothetical protein